jgi:hypothetical protein
MPKEVKANVNDMDVTIRGNKVTIEFNMVRPYPSRSGKRNLRFSSGGRQRIPGADNDLVIMVNADEAR